MISEHFIDRCLELAISVPNEYSKCRELFDTINQILDWSTKQGLVDFNPSEFSVKVDLAKFLSKERLDNSRTHTFNVNAILDKLTQGKYKEQVNLVKALQNIKLTNENIDALFKNFTEKLKICQIARDKVKFEALLNDINHDNHESYEEVVKKWESQVLTTYNSLMQVKRVEAISDAACLDLMNDNFDSVLNRYVQSYNNAKIVKTGFDDIDKQLPFGGLEKRRLYIFGGETGVGKSTMLANIITNAIKANVPSDKVDTYLYITAENLIDESLIRFYCCLTGEAVDTVVQKIINESHFHKEIKTTIVSRLKEFNANIVFYYVEPRKTILPEVESIIENVSRNTQLKAVFLDYLDLIRSGTNQAELRHELGEITLGLKQMAITYDIAMITATQLNKTGYGGGEATITSMKESMRKAEDCDFVAFLQNPKEKSIKYRSDNGIVEAQVVKFTILKSRNGPVGHSANFVMEKTRDGFATFNFKFQPMPKVKSSSKIEEGFDEDSY